MCRRTIRVHLRSNRVHTHDQWVCWGRNLVRNGDHLVSEFPVILQVHLSPRISPLMCRRTDRVRDNDRWVCWRSNRVQNNDRWVCRGRNLVRNGDHLVPEFPVIRHEPLRKLRHVRLQLHTRGAPSGFRKVDVRLPGKGNSNSHGARPVHLIMTMIKWTRTSRLSIKKSLFPAANEK